MHRKTILLVMAKKGRKKSDLTPREEEVMQMLWDNGPQFVRQLVERYPDPRPHFNTVSTVIRGLEEKGYVTHEQIGGSYRYQAVKPKEEFRERSFMQLVKGYFNNNYLGAVSALVEEEKVTVDELKELIAMIEKNK